MKTIRKPTLSKSNMRGNIKTYENLLHEIKQWNHIVKNPDSKLEKSVYLLGYDIYEMSYHGWIGEAAQPEREGMRTIYNTCIYLEQMLKDVLGIEDKCYDDELNTDGYSKWELKENKSIDC